MRPVYRRLLAYLAPHRRAFAVAVAAGLAFAVLDTAVYVLLIPFSEALFGVGPPAASAGGAVQALLDRTVYAWIDPRDGGAALRATIGLILGVMLVKNAVLFLRTYFAARVEQGVARDLRDDLFDRLVGLDVGWVERVRRGQILNRVTTEIEQVRVLVTAQLSKVLFHALEVVIALVAMIALSWKLTLAALVVVPAAMAVWGPLVGVLRRRDRRVLHLGGEIAGHVQGTLEGFRVVKASGAEERERRDFRALTARHFGHLMRAEAARAMAAPATELLATAGTVILLWYGSHLVGSGEMTGAHFVGFLGLALKMYQPAKHIAKLPATAQPGLVAAERVFEVVDAEVEIADRPGALALPGFHDRIAFERVSFAYRDGEPALHDVSFEVRKGTVVALVGPSGSGKTTIVDLLARFFDVTSGRVTIDGHDVRDVRLSDLRSLLGIVSQDTVLFDASARANLAYGRPQASEEEIVAAARAAGAHDFLSALPDGYDTVLGPLGVGLSGGERQRVAIARALLRDAPILVLDEATSALDPESERAVAAAMARLVEGRTVFVVAHRGETARRADTILVLEEGRIVERGTPDELAGAGGPYARIFSPVPTAGRGVPPRADPVAGHGVVRAP